MIKVNKMINLHQLDQEFNGKGLIANHDETGKIVEVGLADNNDGELSDLEIAIEKHKAVDETAIRKAARQALLDKLGITADEAKLLLG
jgi:hypothetical protein